MVETAFRGFGGTTGGWGILWGIVGMLLFNIGFGGTGGGIILLGKFMRDTDIFRGKGIGFWPNLAKTANSRAEKADFGAHLAEVSK